MTALVLGGLYHGQIVDWKCSLEITLGQPGWCYVKTPCVFNADGDVETVDIYVLESLDVDAKLLSEIAYGCWLLGIGFDKAHGLFDIVSDDRFVTYDRGDTWAVWAGLAIEDRSAVEGVLWKLLQSIQHC